MSEFIIAGRQIDATQPCYVIAEAGVNHNGELELAHRLIDAAAAAGADAVKFQTFKAELTMAAFTPKAEYQKNNDGAEGTMFDMVKRLELSYDDFAKLAEHCRHSGIAFMSTAFDADSLDFVVSLKPPVLKWPSGEIDNLPLLRQGAAKGLPIILSTGMASLGDIEAAMAALEAGGCHDIAILHCVSDYPAAFADLNLRAIPALATAFGRPAGLSDHSLGTIAPLAARPLGMCILEKHFTLDRALPGPDHKASLEPSELTAMIRDLRAIESALGDGIKAIRPAELGTRALARRSLRAARPLECGAVIGAEDMIPLRPADGISPMQIDLVVGRTLRRALAPGDKVEWSDL
ncbi:MAG: N-acetylneuraminate synthase, partial [Magnetospirillum sp.]|nr:N-acetylneuraminate synthase [Magnetospirillum sp.]